MNEPQAKSNVFRPVVLLTAAVLFIFVPSYYVYSWQSYKHHATNRIGELYDEIDQQEATVALLASELERRFDQLAMLHQTMAGMSQDEKKRLVELFELHHYPELTEFVGRKSDEDMSQWIERVSKEMSENGLASSTVISAVDEETSEKQM